MEQMKINILDGNQNMTEDGNAVLKAIQNSSTPILDLAIRESIQNSLDASKNPEQPVEVDFQVGNFVSSCLNKYFQQITNTLNSRFTGEYTFLSIRDKGTTGLSGKLCKEDINEKEDLGNLIKLIYDLNKAQDGSGKGGSWGIGKTIYFRLGIGLVIYYSNTKNDQTGAIESRLAACMVEDQNLSNAILPSYKPGQRKSGIAWWGAPKINSEKTIPITDKVFIREFLKTFDIEPFKDTETGTSIIIPYLKTSLVQNNIKTIDDRPRILSWHNSVESFLRVAIQRWYFARLNNKKYQYGSYLKASVNGKPIFKNDMAPVFKYLQALYNKAANVSNDDSSDDITINNVDSINLNKVFNSNSIAGYVSWIKVSAKELNICYPNNDYSPYDYLDMEIKDKTQNRPILTFCRKPAMAVSYQQDGDWLNGVPNTNTDEYLLSIFVLKSDVPLRTDPNTSLDDYARAGERSDHTNWEDHQVNEDNPKIIQKIQRSVSSKLSKELSEKTDDEEIHRISGLSQLLTRLIMPPEGFGKSANGTTKTGGSGGTGGSRTGSLSSTSGGGRSGSSSSGKSNNTGFSTRRSNIISFCSEKTRFESNKVTYIYNVQINKKCKGINIEAQIVLETGKRTMKEWTEDFGFSAPFEVESVFINTTKIGGEDSIKSFSSGTNIFVIKKPIISIDLKKTNDKIAYGSNIIFSEQKEYEFELSVTLNVRSLDVKPQLFIETY